MIPLQTVLSAYANGWFPMAVDRGEIRWFSPDPRGIIPLELFHRSRRLARLQRSGRFDVGFDQDFAGVVRACAGIDRDPRDPGSWINGEIIETYCALHARGFAHSVETRRNGRLVGGLYGVTLGGAFFGESMFHRETDASKIALVTLVEHLRGRGFSLLDTQWVTPHLEQFGAVEISKAEYLDLLADALERACSFTP